MGAAADLEDWEGLFTAEDTGPEEGSKANFKSDLFGTDAACLMGGRATLCFSSSSVVISFVFF
jgi:hypothetical protein